MNNRRVTNIKDTVQAVQIIAGFTLHRSVSFVLNTSVTAIQIYLRLNRLKATVMSRRILT